jgi:hypothetical protein
MRRIADGPPAVGQAAEGVEVGGRDAVHGPSLAHGPASAFAGVDDAHAATDARRGTRDPSGRGWHDPVMEAWLPRPLSWSCALTPCGGGFDGHVHDACDELCVVVGDGTEILHAGVPRPAPAGTAFIFRCGERHGYRNGPRQEPHLWLVHYRADPALEAACPVLADPDPGRRVWRLDPGRLAGFQALFMRFMAEAMRGEAAGNAPAASAWLRLLLIEVARWRDGAWPTTAHADPELAGLWQIVGEHVEASDGDFRAALAHRVPGYDALRHRFRRQFGLPPSALRERMRMERAKYLLLDTPLAVAAIAERLGYSRSAEFCRAFARRVGVPPGVFRRHPGGRR